MIRRLSNIRPALIYGFVLLWACHFSFGMFYSYHPEYVHAHDGETQTHEHSGRFYSLEMDALANWIKPGHTPLLPGETHHHSEGLPENDAETVQYDINKSSLPKIQLGLDFNSDATLIFFDPAETKTLHSLLISSPPPRRSLLYLQSFSERSPPLRV